MAACHPAGGAGQGPPQLRPLQHLIRRAHRGICNSLLWDAPFDDVVPGWYDPHRKLARSRGIVLPSDPLQAGAGPAYFSRLRRGRSQGSAFCRAFFGYFLENLIVPPLQYRLAGLPRWSIRERKLPAEMGHGHWQR